MNNYIYDITIQFVDSNADFSPDIMEEIAKAVEFYNQRSILATNPKSIKSYKLQDQKTLKIVLESKAELPYPGKALQTFSRYLIDPQNKCSVQRFIRGNSIFKMSSQLIDTETQSLNSANDKDSIATLKLRAMFLILTMTISSEKQQQLEEVVKLLEGGEHAYNYGSDKGN